MRTRAEPAGVLASVRAAVRAVAPDEPIYDVELMAARIASFSSDRRFNMGLFTFFAATALLLAMIGIYGVLANFVLQRTQEIGVRLALGAQLGDVLKLVLGHGLRLSLLGAGIGLAGALALVRLLGSLLPALGSPEPLTLAAVVLCLLGVALLACYLPARRATRVNPIDALRAD